MNHIQHMLWDLDGVHFRHDSQYQSALHASLAHFISATQDISFAEALALANQSQRDIGSCFSPFMEQYNLPFEFLAQNTYETLDVSFMQPDHTLISLLYTTGTDHAIVTKSNMAWAKRVIKQLQLENFFPETNIIACAEHQGFSKADNPAAYQHALTTFGFLPENTLMIEDTQKNLKCAKQLGITTVLVHSVETQQNYTDHIYETPVTFLENFIQKKTPAIGVS